MRLFQAGAHCGGRSMGAEETLQSWSVGDVLITKVPELEFTSLAQLVPDATPEALAPLSWLRPDFVTDTGELIVSIHALLVKTPSLNVLVDTCVGNDKPRPMMPML